MKLEDLPKDCIAQVLSCTSPRDACRFSLLSKYIRDAAESELVWEKFLPFDYKDIVSRSVSPLPLTSKKELFLQVSGPLLIDGGKKIFWMEKCGGNKICYVLGARDLSISWATDPLCWCWKYFLPSRFPEIVELIMVHRLEIKGNINTKFLSPNTTYAAYLIIKLAGRAYGLHTLPSHVSIEVGNDFKSNATTSLKQRRIHDQAEVSFSTCDEDKERVLHERKDGWLEIELGEFYNDASEKEVKMSLKEVEGVHLKGGLIVEGIEIRPKPK